MQLREETALLEDGPLETPSEPDLHLVDDEASYCRWADDGGKNLD